MHTLNPRKLASLALGLAVLGCLWFYLAPVGLGGSTTYVVTEGVSMEPRFHTGDLAIVRGQSSYHVGEIVAYHSDAFHTIVLHRIIAVDGGRYVFKGDNNNFTDFEHPARSQLIGALWIHIPGAGAQLKSLRSPALTGALFSLGVLLLAGTLYTQRRRLRGKARRAAGHAQRPQGPVPHRSSEPVAGVLAIGLLALLPFAALALLAFTRPAAARRTVSVPYRQSAVVSYSADAPPGPVYAGDRVVTGDPIFTHVLSEVEFRFAYLFHAAAAHSLRGKAAIYAAITAPSGWQTTLQLGQPTYFRGDRATVAARLDLNSLLAMLRSVAAMTQVDGSSYTLTLTPHVSATGSLDAAPLHVTFSPPIQFTLSALELQTAAAAGGSSSSATHAASQFAPSSTGAVNGSRYEPQFLSFGVAQLSVTTAREIALGGIAIVLCILMAALALVRRSTGRDEAAAIRQRYRHLIVPVERVWQLPGVAVIDVADMDALVRIAEHYERSILCERTAEGEAFWVTDESGQFRFLASAAAPAVDDAAPVLEQPAPDTLAGQLYTQELELGGVISAFATQAQPAPAPEPVAESAFEPESERAFEPAPAPEPALSPEPAFAPEPEPQPAPEPAPAEPAAQEDWQAAVVAEAVMLGGEDWRLACESAGLVFTAPGLS
ncbi:MAG TPA: signal peptidase I [Solirubrobacteraceae bacterium]|nr:signal peptidase I [Solirubrobacteraceae bacterium]